MIARRLIEQQLACVIEKTQLSLILTRRIDRYIYRDCSNLS